MKGVVTILYNKHNSECINYIEQTDRKNIQKHFMKEPKYTGAGATRPIT